MAGVKEVGFKIKIPLAKETTDTTKGVDKFRKGLVDLQKKELPKLTKSTKEYLKSTKDGLREVEQAAERSGRSFSKSMEDGLRSLNRFSTKLGDLKKNVLNLRTAIAGTAIGAGALWAGSKIYEGGKNSLALQGRARREFGDGAEQLRGVAASAGRRAGVSEDDMLKGLIPFRERLDDIEGGAQFRGMKRKLTPDAAKKLQEKNLKFGANLMARVSTLAPDLDQGQVGSVMADALSGPEGVRRLITEFNLSKRSKTLAAANEKGDVFKLLRDDERKKYGVTKKGQFLEQGDLVDVLFSRSGMTEDAADAKRRKMDFQLKAIGAQAENALAEIGSKALDKFNNGLAKGATLSDKLEAALKSKEGQKVMGSIADGAVALAEGLVKVATTLPKIGAFIGEHKTSLLALGGALVGLKGMSMLGGALGKGGGTGGLGGMLGGVMGAKPIPVYVTNAGGLGGAGDALGGVAGGLSKGQKVLGAIGGAATALSLGYAVGSFIDEQTGASDKASSWINKKVHQGKEDAGVASFDNHLDVLKMRRNARVADLEAQGMSHGMALYNADHPEAKAQAQPQTINLVVDGKTIASVVSDHQSRDIRNKTARGAAPRYGE